MPDRHADSQEYQGGMRQQLMLPFLLVGIVVAPIFAYIEWQHADLISMAGDMLLTTALVAALVLILIDTGFELAVRLCIAGLFINWTMIAPFGGPAIDHLLLLWWPVFPLIVFFLIPSKEESFCWFAVFLVLLAINGMLFEYNGRMAEFSLSYWSALLITLSAGYVVSRWFDVTRVYRKRLEEKKREIEHQTALQEMMSRELLQARRLEEIGLMTGGIAHDFNNLLSIIIGHTEVLHHALDEAEEEVAESLKKISLGATRGAGLARELLAFAGKAQFENGPIYLDRIVEDMTTLQRIHMSKQIEMVLDIHPVPALIGDSAPFEQVVLNLVRNAIDAMDGRVGRLEVGTDLVNLTEEEVGSLDLFEGPGAGSYIRLWVRDEGCGIPGEVRAKIFDPFFTTKKMGTGLGLVSLKNSISRNKGGIRLESEVGRGTTFTLYYPAPAVDRYDATPPPRGREISGEFVSVRP